MTPAPLDAKADEIAPGVLRALGWAGRLLSSRLVRTVVQAALYLLVGGIPAWTFGLIVAILDAFGPVLKPEVVAELKAFQAVLETYRADAPPAVAAEMPPHYMGASPFRDPAAGAAAVKQMAALSRETIRP